VWGTLPQEAIDVAVILNALRALRPPAPAVRLTAADTALTRRFRTEHQAIRVGIDQLRTAVDTVDEPGSMTPVRQVYATLTREVWPHDSAEEAELYPSLNPVLGGADPTAPMSRAHAEIACQIARLGRLIEDIGDRDPDASKIADLRSIPARRRALSPGQIRTFSLRPTSKMLPVMLPSVSSRYRFRAARSGPAPSRITARVKWPVLAVKVRE
jgi:hypothetical protein